MKKRFTKIIMLIVFINMMITGCAKSKDISTTNENKLKNEFEIISQETIKLDGEIGDNYLAVVKHNKTGKMFVIYTGYRKGGIAPLN